MLKINRQELAGAFGDIGTDFPLLVAVIIASGLESANVLTIFGLLQVLTALAYRMPMPVQPLKAMASLVIAQKIAGNILLGAGLAIGLVMLALSLTGALDRLMRLIPKAVVRGLQLGLGISLCSLAIKEYVAAEQWQGYVLAAVAFVFVLALLDNKKYPAALAVIALGLIYALVFKVSAASFTDAVAFRLPQLFIPTADDIAKGFVLLAIPQIPLSLGNSIIATKQISGDLFPERKDITVKKIGITYSLMNLIAPFLGGIPCCHGAGGMVGHYTFGGRNGGSVLIYGLFYMVLGLFFGNGFQQIVQIFPLPVLGVILFFEGLSLIFLVKDLAHEKRNFLIAVLSGVVAFAMPYGFAVALIIGTMIYYAPIPFKTFTGE
ncbi:putative sulfate/molybdate transporter [Rhodoflexus caldus]|uniref:putative sulfate/molybdate transporter n=1 Tax=Rhodoflexus caldus TaxID=2891236 RepID=UPI00202A0F80|nr:putative sulfate/molybdate transporter [Rhodoflexus caldus]